MGAIDRHHGKGGQISIDPTGGATPVALISLDNYDLDMATQKVRTTAFEDLNETYAIGRPDVKGSYKGFYDNSAQGLKIFDAMVSQVAPYIELLPHKTDTVNKFAGHGWIDGKISVDSNGAVTVSGTFVAADGWEFPSSTP